MVDDVLAAHGRFDILVNNAAILHIGSIVETSMETFVFLASDLAAMVTGADIPVDGGHLAGDYIEGFDRLSKDS